jgi:predicted phage-related endonuclease
MEGSGSGTPAVRQQSLPGLGEGLPDGVVARQIYDRAEWLEWRKPNINASEAAALYGPGIHPYTSAYQLWAERSGKLRSQAETKAMKRGNLLEDDAIELAREERPGWTIIPQRIYLSNSDWRIGATPDAYYFFWQDGVGSPRLGNLQTKTVGKWAFEKFWKNPDTGEPRPPTWVAIQSSIEAILSGCDYAAVAAMVISDGGILDMHIFDDFPLKQGLITTLRPRVQDFWRRVEENDPYPIDWESDKEALLEVYRDSDGSQIDLTGDLEVQTWLTVRDTLTEDVRKGEAAKKARKDIDAQLIERMGNAEIASFGDQIIKAATVRKGAYSVGPTQYRQVRIK